MQFVIFLNVTVFLDQFALQSFQPLAVYLYKFAASGTNQMVVVLMAVFVLKSLNAITKIRHPANAALNQQLESSCNGRIADILILSPGNIK